MECRYCGKYIKMDEQLGCTHLKMKKHLLGVEYATYSKAKGADEEG